MVKDVILHVGMHKTGSTSIQRALTGYDDGVAFYAKFENFNHSAPMHTLFSNDYMRYHVWVKNGLSPSDIEEKRKIYTRDLIADLSRKDRERIIISGEGVSSLQAPEKAKIVEFLSEYVENIYVYCYVRSPISFASSGFQQSVQGGLDVLRDVISPMYRRRLRIFKKLLGPDNVFVRPYSRAQLRAGDVVQDFAHWIGLSGRVSGDVRVNQSLSAPALKLLFNFNRTQACSFGDALTRKARVKLIERLSGLYADADKIDDALFSCVADTSDLKYLQRVWNIEFEERADQPPLTHRQLEAELINYSDVDLERLENTLREIGVYGNYATPKEIVGRLYLHYFAETSNELRREAKKYGPFHLPWSAN